MLTAQQVKEVAINLGADKVGIASMDRYQDAPIQMDPRQIMPEAKSMIVMAFRVMRGSLRGIEEGTFFSNYSSMGYGGLTYLYMPLVVINLSKFIEDHGFEAVPIGHQSDWRAIDTEGTLRTNYSRPVAQGRACPDIMIHLRIAGFLAGLGEIGYSKVFLTPEFGPRQRLGVVLTEAELEPDPIYEGPQLCDHCMECVRECPGSAISTEETVKVTLAGRTVEWGKLDCRACAVAFTGAKVIENPDEEESGYTNDKTTHSRYSPFYRKPRNLYNTGQAICGGRGCMRACMIHLEKRGVLKNKFEKPFRRRKPWLVDWSKPVPVSQTVSQQEKEKEEAD
jgi:epoxyqueuosine reductase